MVQELPAYIEAPIKAKLGHRIEAVCKSLPDTETLDRIFVSTSSGEGGRPNYPSIWLFTQHLIVEIRNPLSSDRMQHELAPFFKAVDWIRLNARKYEFADPSDESQLELEFTTKDGYSGELSASGKACSDLIDVYRQRFLPNFTGTQASTVSDHENES